MSEKITESPRLIDVASTLEKKGRTDDAEYYRVIYPELISLIYGIAVDELLHMTVDDISVLRLPPEKPAKYDDWDNFWFGRASFGSGG